jgi:hypothetical protein
MKIVKIGRNYELQTNQGRWVASYRNRKDAEADRRSKAYLKTRGYRSRGPNAVVSNPKIHPAVWIVGGLLLAGGGYMTYRYFKTHFTVASGAAYAVPTGAGITLNLPAGGIWSGLAASDGSQISVNIGQTGPLQFTAGAVGTSYTAAWSLSGTPQTATITAQ